MQNNQPSVKTKIFFWFILGVFSTFFAEVISANEPFVFFKPSGWIFAFPVYALHILVLAYLVFHFGRPVFYVLFPAGMIFGMYEAYFTKVLWNGFPGSSAPMWPLIHGIAPGEFVTLVFYWHPYMAFIIPLIFGEVILTSSRETLNCLPAWLKKILTTRSKAIFSLFVLAFLFAAVHSHNIRSPQQIILAAFLNGAFLFFLIVVWREYLHGNNFSILELLPGKRGFYILALILLAFFFFAGFLLETEKLPGFKPQLIILASYAFLFFIFSVNLRKSKKYAPKTQFSSLEIFSYRLTLVLLIFFTITAIILKILLGPMTMSAFAILFLAGAGSGIIIFLGSVVNLLRKPRKD